MTRRSLTLWAVLVVAIAIWMVPPGPQAKSEDTQPKATPTQEDVDALVRSGQVAVDVLNSDGRICRDKAAKALRAALTPFQKG